MNNDAYHNLRFYTYLLFFIVLIFFLLYEGRMLFIPLSFGFLISFIFYPVCLRLEKYLGRMGGITVCLLILIAFGFLLLQLLANSFLFLQQQFAGSEEKILSQLGGLLDQLGNLFGIGAEQQKDILEQLYDNLLKDIFPLIRETVFQSAVSLTVILIVPIFVALILYYRELLVKFVLAIVPDNYVEGFKSSITEMAATYFQFAKGMALVYLIVGILNSIGFLAIGLPHAVYLGGLAAVLTFFPYIGIMIGGLAAVIVAWTTFDSAWYPLAVVAILGVVQYLEANVIFPIAVGHQLKINPLATFIAIIIGGIIWGGAGMILFVLFAAILKILADHLEELKPLAILIGEGERRENRPRWWFKASNPK